MTKISACQQPHKDLERLKYFVKKINLVAVHLIEVTI